MLLIALSWACRYVYICLYTRWLYYSCLSIFYRQQSLRLCFRTNFARFFRFSIPSFCYIPVTDFNTNNVNDNMALPSSRVEEISQVADANGASATSSFCIPHLSIFVSRESVTLTWPISILIEESQIGWSRCIIRALRITSTLDGSVWCFKAEQIHLCSIVETVLGIRISKLGIGDNRFCGGGSPENWAVC